MALLHYVDFEVGGWGEFASACPGPGPVASQSPDAAFPERGQVGVRLAVAAGADGYVTTRDFGGQTAPTVGLWLKLHSGYVAADGDTLSLVGSPAGDWAVQIRYSTAISGWSLRLRDPAGAGDAAVALPRDRWVYVIAKSILHASAGQRQIYSDGSLRLSASGLANAGSVSALRIGAQAVAGSPTVTLDLDEIKFADAYADAQPSVPTPPVDWPCPERTLIVTRADDPDSEAWGEYYRAARAVPRANWCRVPCSADESLADYATFLAEVETPLLAWLANNPAVAGQITTICLGHRVPGAYVAATPGGDRACSAASRLTRLGLVDGVWSNPFYDEQAGDIRRITADRLAAAGDVRFLVSRIDAPDLAAAKALVDRAVALDSTTLCGQGWLSPYGEQGLPGGGLEVYEDLLEQWAGHLDAQLLKQRINRTAEADPGDSICFPQITGDAWFFGWANDPMPPAFFASPAGERALFVDARDRAAAALRGGSPHSCGLAIAAGYALAAGATDSPAVSDSSAGLLAPWPLFSALRGGFTWAEAFYLAVPQLNWVQTPIGDPLATVRLPQAGYHLYRGQGSPEAIDYAAIIAAASADAAGVRIPAVAGGWPGDVDWYIAVRPVDDGGVEYSDPQAVLQIRFEPSGEVIRPQPAAVRLLAAQPAAGSRLRVNWSYGPDDPTAAATEFEVFVGPADAQTLDELLAGPPAATVPAGSAASSHSYAWSSPPLGDATSYRVAVRGKTSGGVAGPAADVTATVRASRAVYVNLLRGEVR